VASIGMNGKAGARERSSVKSGARVRRDARGRSEFYAGINSAPRAANLVRVATAGRRRNGGIDADDEELIAHRRAVKAPFGVRRPYNRPRRSWRRRPSVPCTVYTGRPERCNSAGSCSTF
jgi:hypothetical protein